MKEFQVPEIKIQVFAAEDVITTSWQPGQNELPGDPL